MTNANYWIKNEQGQYQFQGGRQNWQLAADIAAECRYFVLDVEEELVADEEKSCYNCRFRRWTSNSFVCMQHDK